MTAATGFGLLGELEVIHNGRALPLPTAKLRVVLATLLLKANQTVPVDELIDRLWGEKPPRAARNTAQTYVMRLRQVLGDNGIIRTRPGGYVITIEPAQLDVWRFHELVKRAKHEDPAQAAATLQEALSLWRGPALADIPSESLKRDELPTLTEERLRVLERRIDLDLQLGREDDLIGELSVLTGEHPLRERFWAQLMLALYRSGRQAEALVSYKKIRRVLIGDLGVEPGAELQRLHESILRDDSRPRRAEAGTTPALPRQLPADITAFTGRATEFAALDRLAARATAAEILAISGPPGVGKTALAVRWGHHAADRFPDGQLFLNLHGSDPDRPPTHPNAALGHLLRALGTPPGMPTNLEERAALYRSTMAGRRMLIVLDDAAAADQVRPLLPGASRCLVVVTSRHQLIELVAVDGAHDLTLDVLDPTDAVALLEKILGRQRVSAEPEAAAELARYCGYLPLTLRVAAGRLTMRPEQRIAGSIPVYPAGFGWTNHWNWFARCRGPAGWWRPPAS